MKSLALLKKKATVRRRDEDEDRWKPTLLHRLRAADALHAKYTSIAVAAGGERDRPMVAAENQQDQKSSPHLAVMYRIVKFVTQELERMDGDDARLCVNRQRKYGMRHDGSHGAYKGRKATSIEVTTALLERYCATPLLEVLDAAREAKHKLDDLCDAFLLALATAVEWFAMAVKQSDPKARPLRDGARPPVAGATLRVLGVDPGTVNYAHCLVEVSELLPPPSAPALTDAEADEGGYEKMDRDLQREPQPVFRVLLWELLNIRDTPAGDPSTAKVHFSLDASALAAPPVFYRPSVRDVGEMLLFQQRPKKRKRAVAFNNDKDAEEEEEGEEQVARRGGGRRKRLKKASAPAEVVIDLTEEPQPTPPLLSAWPDD